MAAVVLIVLAIVNHQLLLIGNQIPKDIKMIMRETIHTHPIYRLNSKMMLHLINQAKINNNHGII